MLVHSRYRNATLNLARNKAIVTLWDDQYRSRMMTKLHNYGILDILFQAAFSWVTSVWVSRSRKPSRKGAFEILRLCVVRILLENPFIKLRHKDNNSK